MWWIESHLRFEVIHDIPPVAGETHSRMLAGLPFDVLTDALQATGRELCLEFRFVRDCWHPAVLAT